MTAEERRSLKLFTIHPAFGNWFVKMSDLDGKNGRMIALCSRQSDAYHIAETLINAPQPKKGQP